MRLEIARDDAGGVHRFDVLDGSRYTAARHAVETLAVHERRRGGATAVLMEFDPWEPLGIGEELQGLGDFSVLVENAAGIRRVVGVRASGREAAIDAAARSAPASRPILARVRYVCLGTCGFCGVALFADMKTRETRRGRKCFDCW